jgi:hypothetical protein
VVTASNVTQTRSITKAHECVPIDIFFNPHRITDAFPRTSMHTGAESFGAYLPVPDLIYVLSGDLIFRHHLSSALTICLASPFPFQLGHFRLWSRVSELFWRSPDFYTISTAALVYHQFLCIAVYIIRRLFCSSVRLVSGPSSVMLLVLWLAIDGVSWFRFWRIPCDRRFLLEFSTRGMGIVVHV